MTVKVYRAWTRISLLVFGMWFNALFADATVLAWDRASTMICGIAVASPFAALAMHIPFTRIVATTEGIKMHATAATNIFISWSAITRVWSAESDREGGLVSVYCPLVTVADGRMVEPTPVAVYRRAAAPRVADELEELRQAWTGTPSEVWR